MYRIDVQSSILLSKSAHYICLVAILYKLNLCNQPSWLFC